MSTAKIELTAKGKRTRTALLATARQIIAEMGLQALTVMHVCDLAGVGRTSFYNYFRDGEELVAAVAGETAKAMKQRFDTLHEDVPRGLQRLEECLSMILTTAAEDRETMLLLTSLAESEPSLSQLVRSEIHAELQGAGKAGSLQATDKEVGNLAQFLTIGVLALSREVALGRIGKAQIPSHIRALMAACCRE